MHHAVWPVLGQHRLHLTIVGDITRQQPRPTQRTPRTKRNDRVRIGPCRAARRSQKNPKPPSTANAAPSPYSRSFPYPCSSDWREPATCYGLPLPLPCTVGYDANHSHPDLQSRVRYRHSGHVFLRSPHALHSAPMSADERASLSPIVPLHRSMRSPQPACSKQLAPTPSHRLFFQLAKNQRPTPPSVACIAPRSRQD